MGRDPQSRHPLDLHAIERGSAVKIKHFASRNKLRELESMNL